MAKDDSVRDQDVAKDYERQKEIEDNRRAIGGVCNHEGDLAVSSSGGKFYWSISSNGEDNWEEISCTLYDALVAHSDDMEGAKFWRPLAARLYRRVKAGAKGFEANAEGITRAIVGLSLTSLVVFACIKVIWFM